MSFISHFTWWSDTPVDMSVRYVSWILTQLKIHFLIVPTTFVSTAVKNYAKAPRAQGLVFLQALFIT